jgi:hypothetical protein
MIIHQEVMVSPPISLGTSLSALAFGETRRLRDKEHLKYVASRSCLICGRQSSEPHHVRFTRSSGTRASRCRAAQCCGCAA